MPRDKVILDIRIYEVHRGDYKPATGHFGYVFHQPKSSASITSRIARKLRELGFTIGGRSDHFYIDLDADLAPGTMLLPIQHDHRIKRLRYGLDRQQFNESKDEERDDVLTRATFAALRHVTDDPDEIHAIDSVEQALTEHGSQLEITHKVKSTKTYTVAITFKIRPNGGRSVAFVLHTDNKSKESLRSNPIELFRHSDIYLLCGTIAVKNRCVILNPYESIEGQVVSKPYKTPLEIPLDTMHPA